MTGNVVSRRYAKALFAIGTAKGEADLKAYGDQLMELAGALEQSPEALGFFRDPTFNTEEKKSVLTRIIEKMSMDQMVRNFCDLLAEKGRLEQIPAIASDYKDMLDVAQGIVTGELVTVKELSEERKTELKGRLEEKAGKKLELAFAVDKDILGGVVLKIGDKVLDASLRAQLQNLKENIKRGE
ncbi:ATP synthase F1 subunit delta [Pseudodesulfovibrio tunisiensis]|uniref:ATP synthase F1 subunit delta n=1 Tax=Pseudodesulfovibrio tunisiensis TaxID=463192 RepID=UPI001FB2D26A|nr:ATP synthase F1 subunit delta [Pseudodesulfovibrio tunisiensis]